MKNIATITRKEYMENSTELHHAYFLQFSTEQTKRFILNSLKIEDIKEALVKGDKHLNNLKIPYNRMGSGGGWWWDDAPINTSLLKELGEGNSQSTRTCVSKAVAKELVKQLSK
jgi:hypothetical protein